MERVYTACWTLIRSWSRTGQARADLTGPNCGGPLAVPMARSCEHCNAKVTAGELDWVLSRIEQDEAYAG